MIILCLQLQEDNVSYLLTVEQELICERSHVVEIQKELRLANEGRMKLQHDLGDAVAREGTILHLYFTSLTQTL